MRKGGLTSRSTTGTSSVPPAEPKKASSGGVRAFLAANRNRFPKRSSPVFHDEPKTNDLPLAMVKSARKSGSLNLSGKNLNIVPPKVWKINDLDENEKTNVSVSLDNPSEEKWWEFVDLQKLILANNSIMEIPKDVGNLMSLQTLDAHDNQIEKVANEIGELQSLQKLNLSHNKIAQLPDGVYKLKRLTELRLGHNKIEEVSDEIQNLSSLQYCDVSNNCIKKLPDDLGYLSFLTHLNISGNKLKELPSDIGGLTGLRTLDVSENCLTSIPSTIRELTHLEILYLRKNRLKLIPDVSKCGILKELYMQNNLITTFNSEVFSMTKIQLLDFRTNKIDKLIINKDHLEFVDRFYLDNNDIAELPDDLALLPALKSLTLDGNPLRGIRLDILQRGTGELLKYLRTKVTKVPGHEEETDGGSFFFDRPNAGSNGSSTTTSPRGTSNSSNLSLDPYKLRATRMLNVSNRAIKALEDEVFEVAASSQVNVVDLSKNQLTSIPESIRMVGEFLNELKLDGNKLTSLPACIGSFTRLEFFTFQNNQITELPPEFSGLKNLREINFSYNRMQTFPECLYNLEKLEIIVGADNKIVQFDAGRLKELKRLSVFDLRNNNIAQLPPELGLVTQLRSLNMEGNAFRVPSYHILNQGTETVMNYLRNRIVNK